MRDDVNNNRKVWFITGAGRGMGADIAQAVLAAGHAVVATGRDTDRIAAALGHSENLLPVRLDVTSRADAEAAVHTAVSRFGRIDVLVNNAASFFAGYFEELTPEQVDRQLAVSLIGAGSAGRRVGYGSASQFSRDYSRFFGDAPQRDALRLRGTSSTTPDV